MPSRSPTSEIAHLSGAIAAVGMCDPEWLARTHGLAMVEAGRLTPDGTDATYRCTRAAAFLLEVAAASVLRPATPESLSPWLAVGLALTF